MHLAPSGQARAATHRYRPPGPLPGIPASSPHQSREVLFVGRVGPRVARASGTGLARRAATSIPSRRRSPARRARPPPRAPSTERSRDTCHPVSSTSGKLSDRSSRGDPLDRPVARRSAPSSRSLCGLFEAIARRSGKATLRRRAPRAGPWSARLIPDAARSTSPSRSAAAEGLALGGSLHLDELPASRHDDVEVDLGAGVLLVAEIETRVSVHETDADGGNRVGQQVVQERALCGATRAARAPGRCSRR